MHLYNYVSYQHPPNLMATYCPQSVVSAVYIYTAHLQATMFGVPVYPWMTYAVVVAFTFTMLVLFQLGTYNFTYYL